MCAQKDDQRPSLLKSVLTNRCARCRRGHLFSYSNPYNLRHMQDMPEKCPVCGQLLEIEPGFYFGTGYVSYALSVMVCVASFIAWNVFIGISLNDNRLFWWIGLNAVLLLVLQPVLMRMSRSIWLHFFVRYDPDFAKEPGTNPVVPNLQKV